MAIARRIEQVSDNTLSMNQGTIYPALLRLQQRRWIKAEWGISETDRRAKFYSLARLGRKQIEDGDRELGTDCRHDGALSRSVPLGV